MIEAAPFKRLILRAVLRQVSPMVIRIVSVSDRMDLPKFHLIFRTLLGWTGDLGYILRIHGQEFNSFRRRTRSVALHEFRLHRQEKFIYICDTLDMWEWEVRVLDIEEGVEDDHAPKCLGGRGAAPPEFCGGPTGYRLMLKRQREGEAMSNPAQVEAGIQMLAAACPDQPASSWDLLREAFQEAMKNADRRLQQSGPLEPERFDFKVASERLVELTRTRGIGA